MHILLDLGYIKIITEMFLQLSDDRLGSSGISVLCCIDRLLRIVRLCLVLGFRIKRIELALPVILVNLFFFIPLADIIDLLHGLPVVVLVVVTLRLIQIFTEVFVVTQFRLYLVSIVRIPGASGGSGVDVHLFIIQPAGFIIVIFTLQICIHGRLDVLFIFTVLAVHPAVIDTGIIIAVLTALQMTEFIQFRIRILGLIDRGRDQFLVNRLHTGNVHRLKCLIGHFIVPGNGFHSFHCIIEGAVIRLSFQVKIALINDNVIYIVPEVIHRRIR